MDLVSPQVRGLGERHIGDILLEKQPFEEAEWMKANAELGEVAAAANIAARKRNTDATAAKMERVAKYNRRRLQQRADREAATKLREATADDRLLEEK